jgi:hypothetical protein
MSQASNILIFLSHSLCGKVLYSLILLICVIGEVVTQQSGSDIACVLLSKRSTMLTSYSPIYSPLRPPSIPLAVRSPYTSTWSSTVNGSTINSRNVTFWTDFALGWTGIVRVDKTSYEYMGDSPSVSNFSKAAALTVSSDSHYSNFTFDVGPVRVTARFFSPVLPKDLCSSSIPLSYLAVV